MVKIVENLVPKSKYNIKCPYEMSPIGITVHNTANDASAMAEIKYMISNNAEVSFHYAVDDKEAVQGLPLNRNGFHASDGNGTGNRKTIAVEICYSLSGGERFDKAEENAAELIAMLLKQYGWGIEAVKRHYDYAPNKKYCPHRTMDKGWDRFLNMIKSKMSNNEIVTPTPTYKYKVGDVVNINGVYKSSDSTQKLTPAIKRGTITKVINARNPYLLDNGNIGWVNDDCIVSEKPVIYKTITNCYWLNLRTKPSFGNNIYKAVPAGTKVEYLGMESGWAKIKYDNRVLYCGSSYLK